MAGGQGTVCPKTDEILEELHQCKERSVNNYGWPLVQSRTQICRSEATQQRSKVIFTLLFKGGGLTPLHTEESNGSSPLQKNLLP
jgi:hypothetical protein